jgi:hypothetical protein
MWRYVVWSSLRWKLSRLGFRLSPGHPDRIGGLNLFLVGHEGFALILATLSLVMMGSSANQFVAFHKPLNAVEGGLSTFAFFALLAYFVPLAFWTPALIKWRRHGLSRYGKFVYAYNMSFEDKWMEPAGSTPAENPLGSADIQSLADIANAHDRTMAMRVLPVTDMTVRIALGSVIVPLLPLVLFLVPINQLMKTMAGLLWR